MIRKKASSALLFLVIGAVIYVPAVKSGKASSPAPQLDIVEQNDAFAEPNSFINIAYSSGIFAGPTKPAVSNRVKTPAPKKSKKITTQASQKTPQIAKLKPAQSEKPAPIVKTAPDPDNTPRVDVPEPLIPEPLENLCEIRDFDEQFLCLINEYRRQNGRPPLRYDDILSETAFLHSDWMMESGITSHIGENDSKFYERCSAMGTTCRAENIVGGFITVEHLFNLWKGSPSHNATMLGAYSVIGLGVSGDHATTLFR